MKKSLLIFALALFFSAPLTHAVTLGEFLENFTRLFQVATPLTQEVNQQVDVAAMQVASVALASPGSAAQSTPPCYSFSKNLRIGDENEDVRALQTVLAKDQMFSGTISGAFDEDTASAVVDFQETYAAEILTPNKLKRGTGYVGASTRAKLNALYACRAAAASVFTYGDNPDAPELFAIPPCQYIGDVPHTATVHLGDVTGDGKITQADIKAIRAHILGIKDARLEPEQQLAADVTGEGDITTNDVGFITGKLLGTRFTFPACSAETRYAKSTFTPPVSPAITSLAITNCGVITSPGRYRVEKDLMSLNGTCLEVRDTKDVHISCNNQHITSAPIQTGEGSYEFGVNYNNNAVSFTRVHDFSLELCTLASSGYTPLALIDSTDGSITGNRFGLDLVRAEGSSNLSFKRNVFDTARYEQTRTNGSVLEGNTFMYNPSGAPIQAPPSNITFSGGERNRIVSNDIDGGGQGIFAFSAPGADDGIVLKNEKDTIIEDYTIRNAWDCGIENVGTVEGAQIRGNKISNTGYCGIGGWWLSSWKNSVIANNIVEDTAQLFMFTRHWGLRPGETGMYFSDNTFEGNKLIRPRTISGGFTPSYSAFFAAEIPGAVGPFTGERLPVASEVFVSNNKFKGNDFSTTRPAPYFSANFAKSGAVIDGGGNTCGIAFTITVGEAGTEGTYPLKCRPTNSTPQTTDSTTETKGTQPNTPADTITIPSAVSGTVLLSGEKPLVDECGTLGDVNEDKKISQEDSALLRSFVLGLSNLSETQLKNANTSGDLREDGTPDVTMLDNVYLNRYLRGDITRFTSCEMTPESSGTATIITKPPACGSVGDINNDRVLSDEDKNIIRDFTLGKITLTEAQKKDADVNNDKNVNGDDIAYFDSYLTGQRSTFDKCALSKPLIASCGSLGDVNGDGRVSEADADMTSSFVTKRTTPVDEVQVKNADVNLKDGVGTLDSVLIRRYALGLANTFPGCPVEFIAPATTIAELPDTFTKDLVCGQKGDVNNDGRISKADYNLVRPISLGITTGMTEEEVSVAAAAADVNGVDGVTTNDGVLIAGYLLGKTPSFTGCVFVPKNVPLSCGTKGDVTGNGKIDNDDIILMRKHVLGLGSLVGTALSSADVSGMPDPYGNPVSTLDITYLRRYLLGLDTTFPACKMSNTPPVSGSDTVVSPKTVGKPLIASCGSLGDVTGDDRISEEDRTLIRNHILGIVPLPSEKLKNADTNGSGTISTWDVSLMNGYLEGAVSRFAGCDVAPLTITCSPSATTAYTGDTVTWSAQSSGATTVYTYAWQGDGALTGTGSSASVAYTSIGDKTASVTVTSGFDRAEQSCGSVAVSEKPLRAEITAPTGGTFEIGTSLLIAWTSDNPGTELSVNLTDVNGAGSTLIQKKVTAASDSLSWTIPSSVQAGEYKITISKGNTPVKEGLIFSIIKQRVVTKVNIKPLICGSIGDVNNSGDISVADTDLLRTFILGLATPTDAQTTAGDTNGSGFLSTLDITYITGYLVGTQTTFPACPH